MVQQGLDFRQIRLIDMIQLICIHEARAALHVAARRQIDQDVGAAAITHGMDAMCVSIESFVVTSGVKTLHFPKELRVRRERVLKRPVTIAGFA